jgi:hypothetical protein
MNKEKALETCLVITTGFLLLYFIFQVKILLFVAFITGLTGIFIRPLALKIAWLWNKLGDMMGFLVSKMVLTIVFFIILFPIALIYRLIKRDTLMLKDKYNSYWIIRNYKYAKKDMENVW